MSWFGETFGDSLTSLKGQITKITKEVLADDETTANSNQDSDTSLVKELEALCESKDIEINSLRNELCQLQSQQKSEFLNNDSNVSVNSFQLDNSHVDRITQLETELMETKNERDHLISCLDELQAEHNNNLEQLIVVMDQHKQELADLKREYSSTKEELDGLKKQQENDMGSVVGDKEIEEKDNEIRLLRVEIDRLKQEVDRGVREKHESQHTLDEQVRTCEDLKQELEKLSSDVQVLSKEKQDIEEIVTSIKQENGELKTILKQKENENEEIKTKLSDLSKERDELSKKSSKDEQSKARNDQIQNQIKSLLQAFDIKLDGDSNENDFIRHLDSVLNEWNNHRKTKQDQDEKFKNMIENLESDVRRLKEENENLHREMTTSTEKWTEVERKYQKEVASLNNVILELKAAQQEVCINQSQTDDVKRLEQEKTQFMFMLQAKTDEVLHISSAKNNLEQELWDTRNKLETTEKSYKDTIKENQKLLDETVSVRNRESELNEMKIKLEERLKCVESEKSDLGKENDELQSKLQQLETQLSELRIGNERSVSLQSELAEMSSVNRELENMCTKLQKDNCQLQNDIEQLKAQVIIRESNLAESLKSNAAFQDQMNNLQSQINELETVKKELKKWKDASVDLEIQRQDLIAKKEELESECLGLRSQLELLDAKDAELSQLKQANVNLSESCNRLHHELESRLQTEQFRTSKENDLEVKCQKQSETILELQEENNELKSRIQKFQEQMKVQMIETQNQQTVKDDVQQHRRTRSAIDLESGGAKVGVENGEEVRMLKQIIQQEQAKYRELQIQFQEISEKEANARKEFERLKQHLIEIEDHYTEETVESKKTIEDLKLKLMAAEEQLKNSSTLYTSTKVRDNQHLESLQSQIRLVSAQRDDFQSKLSAAEDEVQKHKASLMSLQIVLEQFQQDKEYELESLAAKYETQLQSRENRFRDLEQEMETLRKQLSEAKNGLKAASRLGEQLEKKTQQVSELEESLNVVNNKVKELEESLTAANQTNNGKIDKSLIKNLVVGYVVTPKADQKAQVLRIMASVLDFDQEERNKLGVDNTNSGWLSSILHPKGAGGPPNSQSLSEAFIKFLENESRPQPQFKLLPEQFEGNKSRPSSSSPKPPSHLPELVLPTFSSNQENESSVILKNVLKDS